MGNRYRGTEHLVDDLLESVGVCLSGSRPGRPPSPSHQGADGGRCACPVAGSGPRLPQERCPSGVGDLVVLGDGAGTDPDPTGHVAGLVSQQNTAAEDHEPTA